MHSNNMNATFADNRNPLKIILAPFGTEGDVRPFTWLAGKLEEAGHSVTIMANPIHEERVEAAGYQFAGIGEAEAMLKVLQDERVWSGVEGSFLVMRAILDNLHTCAESFLNAALKADLIIGSSLAVSAAIAAEKTGIPFVRVHFQPVAIRSAESMPILAPNLAWLRRMPPAAVRAFFKIFDLSLDAKPLQEINRYRRSLGLEDWRSFYRDAFCGGDAACGLFPQWFGMPQSDWPLNFRCFDFPLQRGKNARRLSENLEKFLAAGSPPVLWTHGSGNLHTEDFARSSALCCKALGVRGVFVAPSENSFCGIADGDFFRISYAPFETLFGRCRAVIHHGGIGTMAEALTAGVPQLIVPRAHDQFDNADRAQRLGFGLSHPYKKSDSISLTLSRLINDPSYVVKAREYGAKISDNSDIVSWLENVRLRKS